ncbi:hypothetical protein KP79_PYT02034 [Mizuhopecten yessoensis]|uniref:Uncharacterized protein n=1 Tax=Mizuhopecten yessoensis TaxID=6573 RepID=A0A210Q1F5_MIZYE|nr:hypothetical protein KP79_PYT02034 [Mizuhopecten yessoensis]
MSPVAASGILSTLALHRNTESNAEISSVTESGVVTSTEPTATWVASTSQLVVSSKEGSSNNIEATTFEQFISSAESSLSNSEFTSTKQSVVSNSGVAITKGEASTEESGQTKYGITSTKQLYSFTTESNPSNGQLTTSKTVTSTTENSPSNSEFISTKQSAVSSTESSPFNPEVTTAEKQYLSNSNTAAATTNAIINTTAGPLQTREYIHASVESYLSTENPSRPLTTVPFGITKEDTPRPLSSTITPSIIHTLKQKDTVPTSTTSGAPNIATSKTDDLQSPSTYPIETTEPSVTTNYSSVKSLSTSANTNQVTKIVPVSTESFSQYSSPTTSGIDTTTTSPTQQETDHSIRNTVSSGKTSLSTRIPTTTHPVSSGTSTTPRSSSCTAVVLYPGGGKSLLSVRFAGGEKAVSVVAIEKELVELLVSAGYMVDSKEVKAIQTSFDGLTIVNITIDGADLALSATALADVGDRLCKEASMFLVQPPSPARTEDTDDGSGVIAGIVVLVAYLTTLFIIAVILVRRKYRERHRVSSRPMSEVSKVTKTAEQLLDRPETGMTGLSSEYEESNC